jgi:HAD superfamily hydrolase (TIGR01549 family)
VAERKFKAVVLDLFDTLVDWDPDQLPLFEWHGRQMHSTIPWILPELEAALGAEYDRERFVATYTSVYEEINAERERAGIEITCFERFVRTLARMSVAESGRGELAESLARIHMRGVRAATAAPARRVDAVKRLREIYRMGLLSNFDDSRTGWEIMDDTGVRSAFEAIIISADVGMRKPNPKIFERMLEMLKLNAPEVLFVGDTPHHDVAGAKRVGMAAAWIRRHALPLPEGLPQPDYIIDDLAELPDRLENS